MTTAWAGVGQGDAQNGNESGALAPAESVRSSSSVLRSTVYSLPFQTLPCRQ